MAFWEKRARELLLDLLEAAGRRVIARLDGIDRPGPGPLPGGASPPWDGGGAARVVESLCSARAGLECCRWPAGHAGPHLGEFGHRWGGEGWHA